MATPRELESRLSCVTGRCVNQLHYGAKLNFESNLARSICAVSIRHHVEVLIHDGSPRARLELATARLLTHQLTIALLLPRFHNLSPRILLGFVHF